MNNVKFKKDVFSCNSFQRPFLKTFVYFTFENNIVKTAAFLSDVLNSYASKESSQFQNQILNQ